MSLRARLLVATVALVALGLTVADVATYRLLSHSLIRNVDQQLFDALPIAAETFSVPFEEHHQVVLPGWTYAELRDVGGRTLAARFLVAGPLGKGPEPPHLPARLPGSGGGRGDRRFNAPDSYRVLAVALPRTGGTLIVATPLTEIGATTHRLLRIEGLVSGLVLLLAAGLAWWLVRLGMRPLEGIGVTAGAIAAGDLSRRVEPSHGRTEVGRLGMSLNAMLEQIEAAFDERRASEERLRRFVADASHELRTPLTSIRGYAELFRRGADTRPEDLAKTMQRIEAEAERMGVLVDDLLLLARLDQGRPLEREPVGLAAIAEEAVDGARAVDPDRPVTLDVDGSATLTGDAGRLRQVIDNLLDNARVHTPAGTPVHVVVRTEPEGGAVLLTVGDDGPGIEPEVAARAFERFYRGDPARSRQTGGAGLGLSIVAAIVRAHGGTVTVASKGEGATFVVRLPVAPPAG